MTKFLNSALKIKGGGREGDTCEVLRPCHPPKFGTCTIIVGQNHLARMHSNPLVEHTINSARTNIAWDKYKAHFPYLNHQTDPLLTQLQGAEK